MWKKIVLWNRKTRKRETKAVNDLFVRKWTRELIKDFSESDLIKHRVIHSENIGSIKKMPLGNEYKYFCTLFWN